MKTGTLQLASFIVATAILGSGCAELSPGENAAVFGGATGIAAGSIARAAGMSTGESIAVGLASGALVGVTTYIIAKHQATERQRRVAEERARITYERMS